MKPSVLIGISYNGAHNKGDEASSPEAVRVPPHEHADWLRLAVERYKGLALGLDRRVRVIVVAAGLPPILEIEDGSRDLMWEVNQLCTVLFSPRHDGHQVGASTCLRLGLEAAGYWHFGYYLHTAEDILPWPGAVENMLASLDEGNVYAGYSWSDCLNCSFFATRVNPLAGTFDREGVRGHQGLEHYLTHLLRGYPCEVFEGGGKGFYVTTHDYAQFKRWLHKMPGQPNPPNVRTMRDYEKYRDYLANEEG
jgi:hypothetical protein